MWSRRLGAPVGTQGRRTLTATSAREFNKSQSGIIRWDGLKANVRMPLSGVLPLIRHSGHLLTVILLVLEDVRILESISENWNWSWAYLLRRDGRDLWVAASQLAFIIQDRVNVKRRLNTMSALICSALTDLLLTLSGFPVSLPSLSINSFCRSLVRPSCFLKKTTPRSETVTEVD